MIPGECFYPGDWIMLTPAGSFEGNGTKPQTLLIPATTVLLLFPLPGAFGAGRYPF